LETLDEMGLVSESLFFPLQVFVKQEYFLPKVLSLIFGLM